MGEHTAALPTVHTVYIILLMHLLYIAILHSCYSIPTSLKLFAVFMINAAVCQVYILYFLFLFNAVFDVFILYFYSVSGCGGPQFCS